MDFFDQPPGATMHMSDLLHLFAPHLAHMSPSFAEGDALLTVAHSLPPMSGAGMECHLDQTTPQTDFLIRVSNFDGGREALAGYHPWFAFDRSLSTHTGWQPILDFGLDWADPSLPLFTQIENVWLEFDLPPGIRPPLHPSLFFDIDRAGRLNLPETMHIMQLALASLAPQLSTMSLDRIRDCLNCAPVSARLAYIGVMLSRATDAVRVCLSGFDLHEIYSYLQTVGWLGDFTTVAKMLDTYTPNTSKFLLDLDVGRSLEPTVGLEIFFHQTADWAEALTRLSTTGLCTPQTVDRLLAWPGTTPLPTGKLRQFLSTAMRQDVRYLIRRLNHLKLSLDAKGKLTAKAYLYLCYA